jgi:hypothetical protein
MMSGRDPIKVSKKMILPDWGYFDFETGTKFSLGELPAVAAPSGAWAFPLLTEEGSCVYIDGPELRCFVDSESMMHVSTPGSGPDHDVRFSVSALPSEARADLARYIAERLTADSR